MEITTIGLDLAKHVFQVHGIDAAGKVVVVRRAQVLAFFGKLPPCLVGMEACGTSYHWAHELLRLGHEVRLMPPAYVKPCVKRGKYQRLFFFRHTGDDRDAASRWNELHL